MNNKENADSEMKEVIQRILDVNLKICKKNVIKKRQVELEVVKEILVRDQLLQKSQGLTGKCGFIEEKRSYTKAEWNYKGRL